MFNPYFYETSDAILMPYFLFDEAYRTKLKVIDKLLYFSYIVFCLSLLGRLPKCSLYFLSLASHETFLFNKTSFSSFDTTKNPL